jgi:CHAD domain-containing protein
MQEVPQELARAADGLANKAVHDLRVALRRCRSMADSFRAIDPDKNWKKMRRQATALFDSLGALRDCHVMMEWVGKLGRDNDPVTHGLAAYLQEQESSIKHQAQAAIEVFDHKQWNRWTQSLPRRTLRLPLNSEVFQALALERLNAARRLQAQALKTGSDAALHRLRIAIKKFRYVVENFLPILHKDWRDDLKHVQDLLGEIHDLAVLRQAVDQLSKDAPSEAHGHWVEIIQNERAARIQQYRESMSGEKSLWLKWRAGLPRGEAARHASLVRLQAWSSFLDSDVQHSRRVARFAAQLYDGLERIGVLHGEHKDDRELLRAAATVHEVGRVAGNKKHHKKTEKMIVQLRQLVGWKRQDIATMARVARYHRGTLPRLGKLRDMPLEQRNRIKLLAGILRLANALDADHNASIRRFTVGRSDGFVLVQATGLVADSSLAETIAEARHLLEITCNLPVLVRPMPKRPARRKTDRPMNKYK